MIENLQPEITGNLAAIASQFQAGGQVTDIRRFGNGNINATFLVTFDSAGEKHFILQRINTQVFCQPRLVMQNLRTFSEHASQRLAGAPLNRRWEVPKVLLTEDGQDYYLDDRGEFWRAIGFIAASQAFDTIQDRDHAREVGYALGTFHKLLSDLPAARLADTLAGFHITPNYLQQYDAILSKNSPKPCPEINYCFQFVKDRRDWADILEKAKEQGKLSLRPIHGDPKVNNILIDTATKQAVSLIDLDTVKPGLIHYDLGDCLRSGCNLLGEETEQWEEVSFETALCQSIFQGYFIQAREFLTDHDCEYLYNAIRLLAFELGLRFLIDYLAGNVYFNIKYPEHNLARALVQFKLTESIEAQETDIRTIIEDVK